MRQCPKRPYCVSFVTFTEKGSRPTLLVFSRSKMLEYAYNALSLGYLTLRHRSYKISPQGDYFVERRRRSALRHFCEGFEAVLRYL